MSIAGLCTNEQDSFPYECQEFGCPGNKSCGRSAGLSPKEHPGALFWVLLSLPCHQHVFIQTPFVQEREWVLLLQKLEGFLPRLVNKLLGIVT